MNAKLRKLVEMFRWWRRKLPPVYRAERVTVIGDRVPPGVIQVEGDDECAWAVGMACPCGCGDVVNLSLVPGREANWRLTLHRDGTVSLFPSVWRTVGCRSHYWIRRSRLIWAGFRPEVRWQNR